jgi:hypothetical protein
MRSECYRSRTRGVVIRVRYTCYACYVYDMPVMVPERKDYEDVHEWVSDVAGILYRNHHFSYPNCTATLELFVPCDENKGIGGIGKHVTEH